MEGRRRERARDRQRDSHLVLPLLFRGLTELTIVKMPSFTVAGEDSEVSTSWQSKNNFYLLIYLACKSYLGSKEDIFYNNLFSNHSSGATFRILWYMKLNIFLLKARYFLLISFLVHGRLKNVNVYLKKPHTSTEREHLGNPGLLATGPS